MNANELAEVLEHGERGDRYTGRDMLEAATMLRQQQARIEALKAHPVKEQEMFAEIERLKYDIEDAECVKLCLDRENVPTEDEGGKLSLWGRVCKFAHPVKELTLTEDEIDDVWAACSTGESDTIDMHLFAEAILKKAQEK